VPDSPPKRVRVVLGDVGRRGNQVPHARRELTEQTRVGDALVRGLVRAQLALALRLAAVVIVGLGGLPLVFAFAPRLAAARPFGVALPWLLLGLAAYPFLLAVGLVFVKLAERNERDFAELVERRDQ
jgi:hypothetical protein